MGQTDFREYARHNPWDVPLCEECFRDYLAREREEGDEPLLVADARPVISLPFEHGINLMQLPVEAFGLPDQIVDLSVMSELERQTETGQKNKGCENGQSGCGSHESEFSGLDCEDVCSPPMKPSSFSR